MESKQESQEAKVSSTAYFDSGEIGAIAHLYRAEVHRSTVWRSRLDNTTNWAVVTTGIALSLTFAGPNASPLPLVLVGILVLVFLMFEARRYRYFNVWRARARLLETAFYAPMLTGRGVTVESGWSDLLARDYLAPEHHISFARAVGRRLRRNYGWILAIQLLSYYSKIAIHPTPMTSLAEVADRAAIGPIPGGLVIAAGIVFHGGWVVFAFATWIVELRVRRERGSRIAMG